MNFVVMKQTIHIAYMIYVQSFPHVFLSCWILRWRDYTTPWNLSMTRCITFVKGENRDSFTMAFLVLNYPFRHNFLVSFTKYEAHTSNLFDVSREEEMQLLNISTKSKMTIFSFFSIILVMFVAAIQIWHLKRYFERKKIL